MIPPNDREFWKLVIMGVVGCLCWVIIIACIGLVIHFA